MSNPRIDFFQGNGSHPTPITMPATTIQEGDKVWFNRGSGPEYGTVYTIDQSYVCIDIGDNGMGEPIESIIRSKARVYGSREAVPIR